MEKLEESKLENISGGLSDAANVVIMGAGTSIAVAGVLSGIGCTIAGAVYASKAHKSAQKGNTEKAAKYAKTAKNLSISAASLYVGAPILGRTMQMFGGYGLAKK